MVKQASPDESQAVKKRHASEMSISSDGSSMSRSIQPKKANNDTSNQLAHDTTEGGSSPTSNSSLDPPETLQTQGLQYMPEKPSSLSPAPSSNFRQPGALTFPIEKTAVSSFPFFPDGEIFIAFNNKYAKPFRLHSHQLSVNSSFFSETIEARWKKGQPPIFFSVRKDDGLYSLTYDADLSFEAAMEGEGGMHGYDRLTTTDEEIEHEKAHSTDIGIELYRHVFGLFYNIPLSTSCKNIVQELKQIENLLRACQQIGCVHLLSSYVNAVVVKYRQNIYSAIKTDPARWMRVAIEVQNTSIYTECLTHIAGAWPHCPWPTKTDVLDSGIRRIAAAKSKQLQRQIEDINEAMLLSTICVGPKNEPVKCVFSEMPTWLVVQLFRDTIATALWEMKKSNKASLERGRFYRKLYKGGDAYLCFEQARNKCLEMQSKATWNELGSDLTSLKKYVTQVVAPLAENRLMIDADAYGINYLTCITVEPADIPWENMDD